MNVGGVLTDVASQQVVGNMHGLPVVTDPNITITSGVGTAPGTNDIILVPRVPATWCCGSPASGRGTAGNEGAEPDGAAADLRLPRVLGSSLPGKHLRDHRADGADVLTKSWLIPSSVYLHRNVFTSEELSLIHI